MIIFIKHLPWGVQGTLRKVKTSKYRPEYERASFSQSLLKGPSFKQEGERNGLSPEERCSSLKLLPQYLIHVNQVLHV